MLATKLSSLFLNVPAGVFVGVLIGAIVVVGALAFFVGFILHKKQVEKKMGEVDQRIKIMLDEAESESKALKKEAILEAKEQDLKLRNEFERETKEKKLELQRAEQRLLGSEDLDGGRGALRQRHQRSGVRDQPRAHDLADQRRQVRRHRVHAFLQIREEILAILRQLHDSARSIP